ncbi:MAG: hypothetical protein ACYDAJ_09855 [Nitrosotalea sp.]
MKITIIIGITVLILCTFLYVGQNNSRVTTLNQTTPNATQSFNQTIILERGNVAI